MKFRSTLCLLIFLMSCMIDIPAQAQEETAATAPTNQCNPPGGNKTEQYLFCIRQYTNGILQKVNDLPDYIKAGSAFFLSWMTTDETKESVIPTLQGNFTSFSNEITKNTDAQKQLQPQLVTEFFKDPLDMVGNKSITAEQLPYANDLAYQTLLFSSPNVDGAYFQKDPRKEKNPSINPSLNYFYNASSIRVPHPIPDPKWQGTPETRKRYSSYYSTISAAQTYNGYVLSELYANQQNKNALTDIQKQLVEQASSQEWLTQIGSDNLGLVLRHLLLFSSQMFVLMTRMLDVEKQMLYTQAVTNSLLVTLNLGNEDTLIKRAKGTLP